MKVTLKEIATIGAGQNAPQGDENYCNDGTPFVKAGNLQELIEGGDIKNIQKVSRKVVEEYRLKLFQKGTILFAKSGMSCMKGLVYVLPQDSYVVNHLACITPNQNLSEYLKFYFLFNKPNRLIKDSAYPSISLTDISNIEIEIEENEKREKIVNQLNNLRCSIKLMNNIIAKYDDLVKARFVEMFGDPCKNDLEWKIAKLGNLTCKIGSGATPKGGKESYIGQGITFVRSMNVHDAHFVYKDLAHLNEEQANQLKNVEVKENDVFLNITGASVARACVVPSNILPARVNQHVCIIRCLPEFIDSIFLNYLFINNSYKNALIEIGESNGATRQAITKKQLEELEIIVPPLTLQNRFTDFVKQVDKSKFIQMNSTI